MNTRKEPAIGGPAVSTSQTASIPCVETGSYPYGGAWTPARVIGYEVQMLRALRQIPPTHPARSEWALKNCISEAIVLHTRNLCDFCIPNPRFPGDITPADLFVDHDTDQKYQKLRDLMKRLKDKYETDSDPSNHPGSVRDVFNKRLAHPTKDRTQEFKYTPYLDRVLPVLHEIVAEMVALGGLPPDCFLGGPSGGSGGNTTSTARSEVRASGPYGP